MGDRVQNLARESVDCLLNQDFDGYLKFVYPPEVAKVSEMLESMKKLQTHANESDFPTERRTVKVGKPGRILNYQNELQCVLPVKTNIYRQMGPMKVNMGIYGVSLDGGNHWYFISSNLSTIEAIRKKYPNLSPDLPVIKLSESKGSQPSSISK